MVKLTKENLNNIEFAKFERVKHFHPFLFDNSVYFGILKEWSFNIHRILTDKRSYITIDREGYLHNDDPNKPALVIFKGKRIAKKGFFKHGYLHNKTNYAYFDDYNYIRKSYQAFFIDGKYITTDYNTFSRYSKLIQL